MTQRIVCLAHAAEDVSEIAPLEAALASAGVATNGTLDECDLFLACCPVRGSCPDKEVARAREQLRTNPRTRPWLIAVQFGAAATPECLLGFPAISLCGDWKAGIASIIALLPPEDAATSRTEIDTTNILGGDLVIENKPADSSTQMKISVKDSIVVDGTAIFRNG
jgi:hypothetical protein